MSTTSNGSKSTHLPLPYAREAMQQFWRAHEAEQGRRKVHRWLVAVLGVEFLAFVGLGLWGTAVLVVSSEAGGLWLLAQAMNRSRAKVEAWRRGDMVMWRTLSAQEREAIIQRNRARLGIRWQVNGTLDPE